MFVCTFQLDPESESFLSSTLRGTLKKIDNKMLFVPAAYILCRVWGTVRAGLDYTPNSDVGKTVYTVLLYLQVGTGLR